MGGFYWVLWPSLAGLDVQTERETKRKIETKDTDEKEDRGRWKVTGVVSDRENKSFGSNHVADAEREINPMG